MKGRDAWEAIRLTKGIKVKKLPKRVLSSVKELGNTSKPKKKA